MSDQTLLLVDDDEIFRERLAVSFRRRGYVVFTAANVPEARSVLRHNRPGLVVVDLKMPGENGLQLVKELYARSAIIRVLVLTGYGSIATAVEAMRLGAIDYLTKPVDAAQIEEKFQGVASARPEETPAVPSLDMVEWEHLQRVMHDCHGNISAAARTLGIERRTLQRKLQKHPPPL
ncbi:MAG: response regulator [Terrimicrobiaceae bacterium]